MIESRGMPCRRTTYCNACQLLMSVLYKSALDVWSSCVRLSLEVWTVDVIAACKALQVARKAV